MIFGRRSKGGISVEKITPEHAEERRLEEIDFYMDHPKRTESKAFRKIKEQFHKQGAKCFIDNGFCEGPIEIHHKVVEWSAGTEVDFERVKKDYPSLENPDTIANMMPLCSKHHRGKFHGIHAITYPIWILQKYMTKESLEKFEKAIKDELAKG
jgi:hypothetical protein